MMFGAEGHREELCDSLTDGMWYLSGVGWYSKSRVVQQENPRGVIPMVLSGECEVAVIGSLVDGYSGEDMPSERSGFISACYGPRQGVMGIWRGEVL